MAEQGFKKWIITITVIVASLLELIDTTIVNVSLPVIQGNLGATLEDVAWVVTGYAVANVIILPMSGWLGSRFGRKQYFITSIIVFTIASFLCGNATGLNELILFRILQGLAGGEHVNIDISASHISRDLAPRTTLVQLPHYLV